ncbi:MAG: hypothetical protein HY754_15145 [Nitrospirae bacterium]|nr:hypothetical protein [Nitrospirota bacterium]
MKKVLMILLACFVFFAANIAVGEEQTSTSSQIDEKFQKANDWLKEQKLSVTQSPTDAFVNGYILVVAEGLPKADAVSQGQKRLTAERAAEVLAYRKLAEFLDGVAVVGDSLVKDAELKYDIVRAAVAGFVKGAQVVHKEYSREDEIALVVMKVGMTGPGSFADTLYAKILKPDVKKELLEPQPAYKHKSIALEEKYDGLIVDATDQGFRPALINRIFTQKGEVLYDPSKISQKVLVEQGCGEYTNTIDKAKAALEQRGTKNPLIIKATGTVSPSDLQISDDDAVTVFSANQKAGFLSGAKVAFVLR